MNKIILVDGNNLLFRSYYATAYNGNFMKNSKGFPTNALFGFTNMMNKIILEEKPSYILVAFDKGKTFRHEKYKDYKGGRSETPDELKVQFPIGWTFRKPRTKRKRKKPCRSFGRWNPEAKATTCCFCRCA